MKKVISILLTVILTLSICATRADDVKSADVVGAKPLFAQKAGMGNSTANIQNGGTVAGVGNTVYYNMNGKIYSLDITNPSNTQTVLTDETSIATDMNILDNKLIYMRRNPKTEREKYIGTRHIGSEASEIVYLDLSTKKTDIVTAHGNYPVVYNNELYYLQREPNAENFETSSYDLCKYDFSSKKAIKLKSNIYTLNLNDDNLIYGVYNGQVPAAVDVYDVQYFSFADDSQLSVSGRLSCETSQLNYGKYGHNTISNYTTDGFTYSMVSNNQPATYFKRTDSTGKTKTLSDFVDIAEVYYPNAWGLFCGINYVYYNSDIVFYVKSDNIYMGNYSTGTETLLDIPRLDGLARLQIYKDYLIAVTENGPVVYKIDTSGNVNNSFKFASSADGSKDYSGTFSYNDNYFQNSAEYYNQNLATMSLDFAMSAFGSNEKSSYVDQSKNAVDLLTKTGFTSIESNDDFKSKPEDNTMGAIAAYKDIGNDCTLIALATRGSGYESEWAGNVTLGASGRHQGFDTAAGITENFLSDYIQAHKNDFKGTVKLWLTGYSRGAATVNLAAADIVNSNGIGGINMDKGNIYAYCFETPKGENASQITRENAVKNYKNIHNIVNPADIVTRVAMEDWNFIRYGVDENVIPTQLTSSVYNEQKDAMLTQMENICQNDIDQYLITTDTDTKIHPIDTFQGKQIKWSNIAVKAYLASLPYGKIWTPIVSKPLANIEDSHTNIQTFLDKLVTDISNGVGSRDRYNNKLQSAACSLVPTFILGKQNEVLDKFSDKLRDNKIQILAGLSLNNKAAVMYVLDKCFDDSCNEAGVALPGNEAVTAALNTVINTCLSSFCTNGFDDFATLIDFGFDNVKTGHYPELCLAWMQSRDNNYNSNVINDPFTNSYRILRLNCPVDVSVYDSDNKLVAQIKNDEPQQIENSSIFTAFSVDGEKLVYLPCDDSFRVEVSATGSGTLNYSVDEYNQNSSSFVKIVNYQDIAINEGDSFTGDVPEFSKQDIENTLSGSALDYSLQKDNEKLSPTNTFSGDSAKEATYTVSVSYNENSGFISGGGTYAAGSYASVSEESYDQCNFVGWYIADKLVSTDKTYRFRVNEDTQLTAKWDGERPTIDNGLYKVTLNAGKGGEIISDVDGYYIPGTRQEIIAEAEEGYKFSKWTTSSGGTFDDPTSPDTYYTTDDKDAEITAEFVPIKSDVEPVTEITEPVTDTDTATDDENISIQTTQQGKTADNIASSVTTGQGDELFCILAALCGISAFIIVFVKRKKTEE